MPRPKYSCNRCGEQFEFDGDAISHLMAGKCEIVRCPECGHPKGCTCENTIELLKACVKERDEELTRLRALIPPLAEKLDEAEASIESEWCGCSEGRSDWRKCSKAGGELKELAELLALAGRPGKESGGA